MKLTYRQHLAVTMLTARLTVVDDAHHFVPDDTPALVLEMIQRLLNRIDEKHRE